MSREIKFRAWDKTSDIMRTDISSIDFNQDGSINQINVYSGVDILFPDKEAIVMQYTGLKDKNGVEIYEGDLLTNGLLFLGEVIFDGGAFVCEDRIGAYIDIKAHGRRADLSGLTIVGNIYENPGF